MMQMYTALIFLYRRVRVPDSATFWLLNKLCSLIEWQLLMYPYEWRFLFPVYENSGGTNYSSMF